MEVFCNLGNTTTRRFLCLYCHKEDSAADGYAIYYRFCLEEGDRRLNLRHDHSYYYQVGWLYYVAIRLVLPCRYSASCSALGGLTVTLWGGQRMM